MNNRYREEELDEETTVDDKETEQTTEEPTVEVIDEEKVNYEELYKKANDSYLRTLAEMENYKRRINDERIRERKYASQGLLEKLVNALDIFDKVVSIKTEDENLKNFLIGFQMINNNLKQILEDEGVKKIDAIGKEFNPTFHHAFETAYDETKEEGIVLEEIQSGYMYKDRVLRPASVKVNKKMEDK